MVEMNMWKSLEACLPNSEEWLPLDVGKGPGSGKDEKWFQLAIFIYFTF